MAVMMVLILSMGLDVMMVLEEERVMMVELVVLSTRG